MKRHELLSYEYGQKDKLKTTLPIINKILFGIQKIDSKLLDSHTYAGVDNLTFFGLTLKQRKIVQGVIRKVTGKNMTLAKKVNENYITYRGEMMMGNYEVIFYFKQDLPESCVVTYKTEYEEAGKNFIIGKDDVVYKKVEIIDEIICDDKITLRSTVNG